VRNFRTQGDTDPLRQIRTIGAHFVPLADGTGDTHVSCLHLDAGGRITAPSITHAATLLVVHGVITILESAGAITHINIHAGMGIVVDAGEPYSFNSERGAILLIVEAAELKPDPRGISTPQRIAGATWPMGALDGPSTAIGV
jgi:hypothetical protein